MTISKGAIYGDEYITYGKSNLKRTSIDEVGTGDHLCDLIYTR